MNRRNHSDTIFDTANVIIMCVLLLIFIWPLWFVVAASFSDPNELWMGNVVLLPKGFTLEAYEKLLEYSDIWVGYKNSILYTCLLYTSITNDAGGPDFPEHVELALSEGLQAFEKKIVAMIEYTQEHAVVLISYYDDRQNGYGHTVITVLLEELHKKLGCHCVYSCLLYTSRCV